MVFLASWGIYFYQQDLIELKHPSPPEWSYWSRTHFRQAHRMLSPDFLTSGLIDYALVAHEFTRCLKRLESPNLDGKGLILVTNATGNGGNVSVNGIDNSSYDVSNKSIPWRQGYFDVVMGFARAAEFLDDFVVEKDTKTRILYPKSVVIGPSNPRPRPVPPGVPEPPLEEDCVRPLVPPETLYLRILAGQGFSTSQRLQAALAYANWLEVKGLQESAEETYKWAVDIAASALTDPGSIVDSRTGIIKFNSTAATSSPTSLPSPNLLKAVTALATHHARNGNPNLALPVYTSVLRARQSAPIDTTLTPAQKAVYDPHADTDYGRAWSLAKGLIRKDEYPAEPPSGNDPFIRTPDNGKDCTEAELMLYIGEILFATSSAKTPEDGLGWTKRAIALAQEAAERKTLSSGQKAVCKSCLTAGVSNWGLMVGKLLKEEREREALPNAPGWASWLGFGGSKSGDGLGETRWEREAKEAEALRMKLIEQNIADQMAVAPAPPGGTWLG